MKKYGVRGRCVRREDEPRKIKGIQETVVDKEEQRRCLDFIDENNSMKSEVCCWEKADCD